MKLMSFLALAFVVVLVQPAVGAAPSVIDGFDPDVNGTVRALAVQDGGTMILGGDFTAVGGATHNRLARIAHTGDVITTFTVDVNESVFAVAAQEDGKVLIGGKFTSVNGQSRKYITRLNADGSIDSAFLSTGASYYVNALAVQSDGKILVGGQFSSINGSSKPRIARLNPDGSVDSSFNPGTGASGAVNAIAIQADGKVVIGGDFTSVNGTGRARIARLNANGSLDTAFNPGAGANANVCALAVQVDGKILAGGDFTQMGGYGRSRIARLLPNGAVDSKYTASADQRVSALIVQPDGKVVLGGSFLEVNNTARKRIARLDLEGKLDAAFAPIGANGGDVNALALQADGGVVAGGSFAGVCGTVRNRMARIEAGGALDNTFNTGTGASDCVEYIVVQSDGKIVLTGNFTTTDGLHQCNLKRLLPNGLTDKTFNTQRGRFRSMILQPDQKIVLGGIFENDNGTTFSGVVRLNADGGIDAMFTPAALGFLVYALAIQSDGKIVVGGCLPGGNILKRLNVDGSIDTTYSPQITVESNCGVIWMKIQSGDKLVAFGDGVSPSRLFRLNPDGTCDNTFNAGSINFSSNGGTYRLVLQPNGKIVFPFKYETEKGGYYQKLVRLNENGTPDLTFNADQLTTISVNNTNLKMYSAFCSQADGKMLVAGSIVLKNGGSRRELIRLKPDGSVDVTSNPKIRIQYTSIYNEYIKPNTYYTYYDNEFTSVTVMAVQNDEKILIGGCFTDVNGKPYRNIARLNPDLSLDTSFAPNGCGIAVPAETLAVQPDGRILLGGDFKSINGHFQNNIARLSSAGIQDEAFDPPFDDYPDPIGHPYPVAVLPNGKIQTGTVRLNRDDTIDWSYRPVATFWGGAFFAHAVQRDGKVLVSGHETDMASDAYNIHRLNTDGSSDSTFYASRIYNDRVILTPEEKMLVFTPPTDYTIKGLYRLNQNGSFDGSFSRPIGGSDRIRCKLTQPDGKILVGGNFSNIGGVSCIGIARLNADGSVDSTFKRGALKYTDFFFQHDAMSITLQADGKILVSGIFGTAETPWTSIARLNRDGTLDRTFGPVDFHYHYVSSGNIYVSSVALQPDGKILLLGHFDAVNDRSREFAARLTNPTPARQKLSISEDGRSVMWELGGSCPWPYQVLFEYSSDGVNWGTLGWGTATPWVGYRLSGVNRSLNFNGYVRASGFVQQGYLNSTASLFQSVLRTHDDRNAVEAWVLFE